MNIENIQEILESGARIAVGFAIGWVLKKLFPGLFQRIDSSLGVINRVSLAIGALILGGMAAVCFWAELPVLAAFFSLAAIYAGFVFFTYTEDSVPSQTQSGREEEQCQE